MARSTAIIQKQIQDYTYANYGTNPSDIFYYIFHDEGNNLITPSQTNKFILITYIVAQCVNILEQILDLFKTNLETEIASAPAGSNLWLQNQISLFQYDATTPQIIQFINNAPSYPIVDPSKRVIDQRAVVNDPNGGYICKVASGLAPVSTSILNALGSYLSQINFGVPMTIVNANPDLLMIRADIYYNGQYSSVIVAAVQAAINNWVFQFDTSNFNGNILLSKIEDVIQSVAGVNDVVLTQIENTPDGGSAIVMVNGGQEIIPEQGTVAGYIIIDTNTRRTLNDTLNFIIQ